MTVRVSNQTSDVQNLRAYIIHFDPNIRWVTDVWCGTYTQNCNMSPGSRGMVVYDHSCKRVIVTGYFDLPSSGPGTNVIISGCSSSGYSLSYASC